MLNSGRTARAAINEVFDHGRPNRVMLGILLDRGERQLPIRANFTAKSISLEKHKKISLEQKNDGLLTFSIRMENEKNEIFIEEKIAKAARQSVQKMTEIGR